MRLKPEEIDIIVDVLVAEHPSIEALRAYCASFELRTLIAHVPQGASPAGDLRNILDCLDRDKPQSLLRILRDSAATNQDLAFIAERYEVALRLKVKEPWRERLLWERKVVLDRGPLRETLKTFLQTEWPTVLLVTGPKGSGKSRTTQLVQYVAAEHGHPFAHAAQANTWGVAGTIESLLVQLKASDPFVEEVPSPDSHWFRKQCTRILKAVNEAMSKQGASRCWLVLDEVGPVSGTLYEFCNQLIQSAAHTSTGLRLVFIGYPETTAPAAISDGAIEWDRLSYGMVREADVRDYLLWLHGDKKNMPLTEEALSSELRSLLEGTNPTDEGFLRHLGQELEKRTRATLAAMAGVP
jgi:hypothetical protein